MFDLCIVKLNLTYLFFLFILHMKPSIPQPNNYN